MPKLPAMQFYPGDWLRDQIAGCSLASQGLWLRMMIVMHDSDRYGHLCNNGAPIPPEQAARRCGCSLVEYEALLAELDGVGVPSRTRDNVIYSRRMVRDAEERILNAERQRKHREKVTGVSRGNNADVTPMSHRSSSSSSSSSSTSLSLREKKMSDAIAEGIRRGRK